MSTPILLNIPADGRLILSSEQLRAAGFQPGDRLVLTPTKPGQLYLHKVEMLSSAVDLRESLRQLSQESFQQETKSDCGKDTGVSG